MPAMNRRSFLSSIEPLRAVKRWARGFVFGVGVGGLTLIVTSSVIAAGIIGGIVCAVFVGPDE